MRIQEVLLSFRIPQKMSDRIEAVRSQMAKRNIGIEVEKAQVVRLLIERGLDYVEKELKTLIEEDENKRKKSGIK